MDELYSLNTDFHTKHFDQITETLRLFSRNYSLLSINSCQFSNRKILLYAEFTSAITLVVEIIFLDDSDAAFAQSALAPILLPPLHIGIMGDGIVSGFIYLLQTLPAAGGQGSGNDRKAMFMSITGRIKQPHPEAAEASAAPLRLILHTFDVAKPCLVVIIGIDNLQAEGQGIARTFLLADVVFLQRIDVGVAIIDDGSNSMLHQTFDNGRRARGTTRMEEHSVGSTGDFYLEFLLFHI